MQKTVFFLCIYALIGVSCASKAQLKQKEVQLSDRNATPETVVLYQSLIKLANKGIMFGHQDDLAYGVNWKYEEGRSDVKDVAGDYPAVYGWDIGGLEKKSAKNIDGVPFDKMRQYIKATHERGGINTISWHINNPLNDKDSWDITPKSMASALPGGLSHEKYKLWLNEAVTFLRSLKDEKGKAIPILYRPYHELTGNWFWWCKNNGTPEEFTTLWKFTLNYFQEKGVHNLIYVYNTADFKSREEFLAYYPGSDYADILSFDKYQYDSPQTNTTFVEDCKRQFGIMDQVAKEEHKIMAFAETGYEQIPYSKWWTDTLMKAMGDYKISYVLLWRNHGWNEWMNPPKMHYYAPYEGHLSSKDFVDFYNLDKILFEKDVAKEKLYKK